jgi:excisionase family DNA binding protein
VKKDAQPKGAEPMYRPELEPLMTFREARDFLRVSSSTLRRYLRERTIPFMRLRWAYRFRRSDLIAWMEAEGHQLDGTSVPIEIPISDRMRPLMGHVRHTETLNNLKSIRENALRHGVHDA